MDGQVKGQWVKEGVGTGLRSVLLHLNASKGQIREDKEKKTKIIQFRNMMCYVEFSKANY